MRKGSSLTFLKLEEDGALILEDATAVVGRFTMTESWSSTSEPLRLEDSRLFDHSMNSKISCPIITSTVSQDEESKPLSSERCHPSCCQK